MAPKGSAAEAALNRFGRQVIVAARDNAIWWHDANVADGGHPVSKRAAPDVKQIASDYAVLASLSPDLRAVVRRLVVLAADTAIFHVLKNLDDLRPKLVVGKTEILDAVRGELHGLHLTQAGWFGRFSKYGERGDKKRRPGRAQRGGGPVERAGSQRRRKAGVPAVKDGPPKNQ
jgi:hypothetical protein